MEVLKYSCNHSEPLHYMKLRSNFYGQDASLPEKEILNIYYMLDIGIFTTDKI